MADGARGGGGPVGAAAAARAAGARPGSDPAGLSAAADGAPRGAAVGGDEDVDADAEAGIDSPSDPETSGFRAVLPPGRVALGVAYRGTAYRGWQSQPDGRTVQDHLERALHAFAGRPLATVCAGRTDAGVHALQQVVHVDAPFARDAFSWVRGCNRHLPRDIAVQWACAPGPAFHARNAALGRRYRYWLLASAVRPALDDGLVGWVFRPLDLEAMRQAAGHLIGEHDFSAFRAAGCQSPTPVKTLHAIGIARQGRHWRFDFDGNAFLHHMVRNVMGCLLAVGTGRRPPSWMAEILAERRRERAAPTFGAQGLYFVGPYYDAAHGLPPPPDALDWPR